MSELWMTGALTQDKATSNAGAFTGGAPKGLLHTTEGASYTGALGVYQREGYWPHFTLEPRGPDRIVVVHQHLPINLAAKALEHPSGTGPTNTDNVVQAEIVGFAWALPPGVPSWMLSSSWPDWMLAGLATWMRWVEANHGVAQRSTVAWGDPIVRLTWDDWHNYSGWLGHRHVPSNTHTDPGKPNITRLVGGDDDMPALPVKRGSTSSAQYAILGDKAVRMGSPDQLSRLVAAGLVRGGGPVTIPLAEFDAYWGKPAGV